MWESFDKRKFPRLRVKCDVIVREQNSANIITTETENIGIGGICVYLDHPIESFSPVNIKLELSENSGNPIECSGKIVWCIRSQGIVQSKTRFDIGVEFSNILSEDRERIRTFIQTHIS